MHIYIQTILYGCGVWVNLIDAGISFTHLASAMPAAYKKLKNPPRGVSNRRAALQWIRTNIQQGKQSKILFLVVSVFIILAV